MGKSSTAEETQKPDPEEEVIHHQQHVEEEKRKSREKAMKEVPNLVEAEILKRQLSAISRMERNMILSEDSIREKVGELTSKFHPLEKDSIFLLTPAKKEGKSAESILCPSQDDLHSFLIDTDQTIQKLLFSGTVVLGLQAALDPQKLFSLSDEEHPGFILNYTTLKALLKLHKREAKVTSEVLKVLRNAEKEIQRLKMKPTSAKVEVDGKEVTVFGWVFRTKKPITEINAEGFVELLFGYYEQVFQKLSTWEKVKKTAGRVLSFSWFRGKDLKVEEEKEKARKKVEMELGICVKELYSTT